MTVLLPQLEDDLVKAGVRRARAGGGSRPGAGWRAPAVAVIVLGMVITGLGLIGLGGRHGQPVAAQALERAARAAERGLAAPLLHRGKAWYTREVTTLTSEVSPAGELGPGGAQRSRTPSRGFVQSSFNVDTWVGYGGAMRMRARLARAPRFIGSLRDRANWRRAGSHPPVLLGSGGSIGARGFQLGNRRFSYRQILALPTDPAGVLRFMRSAVAPGPLSLDLIAQLLGDFPLTGGTRAAVFRAVSRLPSVRYLGHSRDSLGRVGAAVGVARAQGWGFFGSAPSGRRYQLSHQLVFDPRTGALLATRVVLQNAVRALHLPAGLVLSSTVYVRSRLVSQVDVPPLPPDLTRATPRPQVRPLRPTRANTVTAPAECVTITRGVTPPPTGARPLPPPPLSPQCRRALRRQASRARARGPGSGKR